jgi:PHD/YefM family antitoxin component YafN of YafNO toxin-antitoxin module
MEGIQFVVDENGKQTAVLIDLERYGELWEDIYDALLLEQRRDDPLETAESVEARLRAQGKLIE